MPDIEARGEWVYIADSRTSAWIALEDAWQDEALGFIWRCAKVLLQMADGGAGERNRRVGRNIAVLAMLMNGWREEGD